MVDMGAEVGQKMRSAIKAKLTELDCYVDDELPDYIMVMVANKRTKNQMNEDLKLFLNTKTSKFVDWLHIVLKKLKEVTVTNLDVYKKVSKRKSSDIIDVKIKKEKRTHTDLNELDEKFDKKIFDKSLTDDLPINVKSLSENRKIALVSKSHREKSEEIFDIPSISNEEKLEEIEKRITDVKSRLGLKVNEEIKENELRMIIENRKMQINAKRNDEFSLNGRYVESDNSKSIPVMTEEPIENLELNDTVQQTLNSKKEHTRIVFSKDDFEFSPKSPPRKKSALKRLGKYSDITVKERSNKSSRKDNEYLEDRRNDRSKNDSWNIEKDRKNESKLNKYDSSPTKKNDLRQSIRNSRSSNNPKKDVKKRLELSSKITVPHIDPQLLEDTFKKREVVSVVKVKPRLLPPNSEQANKNLLLKAIADAQKSIAQTKPRRNTQKNDSNVEKSKKQEFQDVLDINRHKSNKKETENKRISVNEKEKLKRYLSTSISVKEDEQKYVPEPIKKSISDVEYVPSSLNELPKEKQTKDNQNKEHQFIVTLDGVQKLDIIRKISVKDRLDGRRTPSPIFFENSEPKTPIQTNTLPTSLPIVPVTSKKINEKCKYFPTCRNGEKCEFYHPSKNCEQFPYCTFGDKCLYIHPSCKFGSSCTRRNCVYSHGNRLKQLAPVTPIKMQTVSPQTCKYFPNCVNINCPFYHPKPCKFGKFCKNQSVCNYVHSIIPNKSSLTWKPK